MNKLTWWLIAFSAVMACNTHPQNKSKIDTMQTDVVDVTRSVDSGYTFIMKGNQKLDIQKGVSENAIESAVIATSTSDTSFNISCPYPQQRFVFAVTNAKTGNVFYVSEKHIPMQGTPNFRDMGGIVTTNGRQVRWGTMFRSGALAELTNSDLTYFKTLRIGKVIDFRMHDEIQREPDRYPDSTVQCIHAMIGNPADVGAAMNMAMSNIAAITPQMVDSMMIKAYENFVASLRDFQPVFDAMMNEGPNKPFLFHCTAGKDRTGIAAALILTTLGVDREVIMDDYLLSNSYAAPYFEANVEKMTTYGFTPDVAKALGSVKREYLQTLFDAIDNRYTNDQAMLEQVFGITPEKRHQLIEKYTVK